MKSARWICGCRRNFCAFCRSAKSIASAETSRSRSISAYSPIPDTANMQEVVKNGTFREDLYFRLNVISLTMPSLRDRREDIKPLAEHFIEKYSKANGIQIRKLSESGAGQAYAICIGRATVRELGKYHAPHRCYCSLPAGPSSRMLFSCRAPARSDSYNQRSAIQQQRTPHVQRWIRRPHGG